MRGAGAPIRRAGSGGSATRARSPARPRVMTGVDEGGTSRGLHRHRRCLRCRAADVNEISTPTARTHTRRISMSHIRTSRHSLQSRHGDETSSFEITAVILDMDGLMLDTETPFNCVRAGGCGPRIQTRLRILQRALVGRSWPTGCGVLAHSVTPFRLRISKHDFEIYGSPHRAARHCDKAWVAGASDVAGEVQPQDGRREVTHAKEAEAHLRAVGIHQRFSLW